MLARLRQMEEEALDDEMDILREIEGEGPGQPTMPSSSITKSAPALTEGGQLMPSSETPTNANGTEAIGGSNNVDEKPALGRDGKPLKVWKKRGQKRTTRRVICKLFPLCTLYFSLHRF
jgi:DNA replication regulator SLD2